MSSFDFQVDKNTLSKHQLLECASSLLANGEVRLFIERFALTANNITYGVMGEKLGYWDFFPAKDNWGRIPVWGIGMVVESNRDDVAVGSRYYGYYPMSSELIVQPENISVKGFKDASLHRKNLSASYNQYSLITKNNGFQPDDDNYHILYRPLFITGILLEDYLKENEYFGANTILISSASSKTAISLAFMLGELGQAKIIGLTSQKNLFFVKSLALYDEVVCYEKLDRIPADQYVTYVDMCGDEVLSQNIERHFNEHLTHCCKVGATHATASNKSAANRSTTARRDNNTKQCQFFAPSQIKKCYQALGSERFSQHIEQSWSRFVGQVDEWVEIIEYSTKQDLLSVYDLLLIGAKPNTGLILVNDKLN